MIVYALVCARQHRFEGWFGSEQDYSRQSAAGLVECPMCGDRAVNRVPSGIHLSSPAGRTESAATAAASESTDCREAMLLRALKQYIISNTENVGREFAALARKMHYGEAPQRNIRGKVTRDEADALTEEGISALPVPAGIVFGEDAQ